jgi:hypothetical protein
MDVLLLRFIGAGIAGGVTIAALLIAVGWSAWRERPATQLLPMVWLAVAQWYLLGLVTGAIPLQRWMHLALITFFGTLAIALIVLKVLYLRGRQGRLAAVTQRSVWVTVLIIGLVFVADGFMLTQASHSGVAKWLGLSVSAWGLAFCLFAATALARLSGRRANSGGFGGDGDK